MLSQRSVRVAVVGAFVGVFLVPTVSWGQNGAIAGAVRDTSGAVLPGVIVEAASPALIEKLRTASTDGEGQYKVLDLRPGIYKVTFSLQGFKTVVRDNLELNAGGTLNITVEMSVGGVEETVTVSGQTPLVDIQNVQQHRVTPQEVIQGLPTARMMQGFTLFVPGVKMGSALQVGNQDVGGNIGEAFLWTVIHGSRVNDSQMLFDGLRTNNLRFGGGGSLTAWQPNAGAVQEVVSDTGGHTAEAATAGTRTNPVPKDGGNTFHFTLFGNFTNSSLQSNNIDAALVAQGVASQTAFDKIGEINPMLGGPLLKDRIWFFTDYRYWINNVVAPGAFRNISLSPLAYVPDKSHPLVTQQKRRWVDLRLTWQATPRNKIAVFADQQSGEQPTSTLNALLSPEATAYFDTRPSHVFQATYNAPVTNRLLIDAGASIFSGAFVFYQQQGQPFPNYSVQDLASGITFGSYRLPNRNYSLNVNTRAKVSYVTGAHALSVGLQTMQGYRSERDWISANNEQITLQVFNGLPVGIVEYATPYLLRDDLNYNLAPFIQDQWTARRLTLNLGLRFDLVRASTPALNLPPTLFVGARNYPAQSDEPNWKDYSPRVGASYDLFGNGKTAIKGSINKYVSGVATGIAEALNPVNATINSATRSWTDISGTGNPANDCDLLNPARNGGCGPLNVATFGTLQRVSGYDPSYLTGWGKRPANWELQAAIQQELRPGVSMSVTYTRHWFQNLLVNKNALLTPLDYSPFCITAPVDSRLPSSGQQICGFYNINPDKFGLTQNVVGLASRYGNATDVYNGVDITINVRLPRGIFVQGGTSTGREVTDFCDVSGKVDNLGGAVTGFGPELQWAQTIGPGSAVNPSGVTSPSTLYCHVSPPFLTDAKAVAVVPLPWGFSSSVAFQSLPGPEILANWAVTNAQVAPSLGRNLSGGAAVTTVQLVAPGSLYGQRLNQVDFRMAKTFTLGKNRIRPMIDFYNLLNVNTVLTLNSTYGPAWQRPTSVEPGRVVKFGAQVDF
jgi:hypothetical protein